MTSIISIHFQSKHKLLLRLKNVKTIQTKVLLKEILIAQVKVKPLVLWKT